MVSIPRNRARLRTFQRAQDPAGPAGLGAGREPSRMRNRARRVHACTRGRVNAAPSALYLAGGAVFPFRLSAALKTFGEILRHLAPLPEEWSQLPVRRVSSSAMTFTAAAPGMRLAKFSAFFIAPLSLWADSCRAGRNRFRCEARTAAPRTPSSSPCPPPACRRSATRAAAAIDLNPPQPTVGVELLSPLSTLIHRCRDDAGWAVLNGNRKIGSVLLLF